MDLYDFDIESELNDENDYFLEVVRMDIEEQHGHGGENIDEGTIVESKKAKHFICNLCKKKYASEGWLNRHLSTVHDKPETECNNTIITATPALIMEIRQSMQDDFMLSSTDNGKFVLQQVESVSDEDFTTIIYTVLANKPIHELNFTRPIANHSMAHLERFVCSALGSSKNVKRAAEEESPTLQHSQSEDTLQALCYVGGCILRKLKSRKWDQETVETLYGWGQASPEVPCQWVQLQDRGGLIHINSELFSIIQLMDSIATNFFHTTPMTNCNITNLLIDTISQHSEFQFKCDTFDSELVYQLCLCYVKIRCKAFAKSKVRQTSASLRHDLMGKPKKSA